MLCGGVFWVPDAEVSGGDGAQHLMPLNVRLETVKFRLCEFHFN